MSGCVGSGALRRILFWNRGDLQFLKTFAMGCHRPIWGENIQFSLAALVDPRVSYREKKLLDKTSPSFRVVIRTHSMGDSWERGRQLYAVAGNADGDRARDIMLNMSQRMVKGGLWVAASLVALFAAGSISSPAQAKDSIVLCTIDDLSGDFSIMSAPKTYGYQLAVKEVNDAGGIMVDGAKKKIKLVTYDGQSDIKKYQELAQKCIFDDGADVVMAAYTGAEREAARREVVRNKVIFWHNNQGEGGIADHYSFFSGPTPEQQLMPSIKWMIEHFGKRLIYIGADYNFCRAIGMWTRVAAGLNGGTVEMDEYFPFGVSQWQATIDKIQKIKPDFQVHCLVGGEQVQFYPQAQAAGLKIPTWSNVTIADGYEHKRFAPPSLANMYVSPGFIEDVPGDNSKKFTAHIRDMFPNVIYVNEHAGFGYVAVKAMAIAWAKAGTTDDRRL